MRGLVIAVILLTPSVASAADFTIETGAGVALSIDHTSRANTATYGFTVPTLSVGAFVTHDLAIIGRVSNAALHTDDNLGFGHETFFGGGVQYWITDGFFVSGALGATALGRGVLVGLGRHQENGFGFNARCGVPFANFDKSTVSGFLEWTAIWYPETQTYIASNRHTVAVGIEWQFGR
jgi:hypothetical protein